MPPGKLRSGAHGYRSTIGVIIARKPVPIVHPFLALLAAVQRAVAIVAAALRFALSTNTDGLRETITAMRDS